MALTVQYTLSTPLPSVFVKTYEAVSEITVSPETGPLSWQCATLVVLYRLLIPVFRTPSSYRLVMTKDEVVNNSSGSVVIYHRSVGLPLSSNANIENFSCCFVIFHDITTTFRILSVYKPTLASDNSRGVSFPPATHHFSDLYNVQPWRYFVLYQMHPMRQTLECYHHRLRALFNPTHRRNKTHHTV